MNSKLLTGQFSHTMDDKGRVKLPGKWDEIVGSEVMVTRGTGCMRFVFTMELGVVFSQRIMALPMMDKKAQALRRMFGGGAECKTDKQGRVLLPPELRKYAQLEKDVVLTGALNWGEIWNAEKWEEYDAMYSDATSEGFDELMSGVTEEFDLCCNLPASLCWPMNASSTSPSSPA